MAFASKKTGTCCKWLGGWLVMNAGFLLYGETAPDVIDPNFTAMFLSLGVGLGIYAWGCIFCAEAQE